MNLQWDDLKIISALVKAGSLNQAALILNVGQSTMSRRLDRLEAVLGVTLFIRAATGLRPTTMCKKLLPDLDIMTIHSQRILKIAGIYTDELVGKVRIAIPHGFDFLLLRNLEDFVKEYPTIELEFLLSNELVDLTRDEADIALRTVRPRFGNLTVQKLGTMKFGVFGSQNCVIRKKTDYQWIIWAPFEDWIRSQIKSPQIVLRTNTLNAAVVALKSGVGVSIVPRALAKEVDLTESEYHWNDWLSQDIFLVGHEVDQKNHRIEIVREFLIQNSAVVFD